MADKVYIAEVTNPVTPTVGMIHHALDHRAGATLADYLDMAGITLDDAYIFDALGNPLGFEPAQITPGPDTQYQTRPHIGFSSSSPGGGGGGSAEKSFERGFMDVVNLIGTIVLAFTPAAPIAPLAGAAGAMLNEYLWPIKITKPTIPTPDVDVWGYSDNYTWIPRNNRLTGGRHIVPLLFGTMRIAGTVISETIWTDGQKQYLKQLILLGEGPFSTITDIEINERPITEYRDVETETKLGTNAQTPITFMRDLRYDRPVGSGVFQASPITVTTEGTAVEGFEVLVQFHQGLYTINLDGRRDALRIELTIEYRLVGAGGWTAWISETINRETSTPFFRNWEKTGLAAGQYEIKITRVTRDHTEERHHSDFRFSKYTEIIPDDLSYPNSALLAVKILATDQLQGSAPTITALCTKDDLTVYEQDGTPHTVSSDGPAWVAWYLLNHPNYGGRVPHAQLLYSEFAALAAHCAESVPDGDGGTEERCKFDGIYDVPMSVFDAVIKALFSCNAQLRKTGSKFGVIADKAEAVSVFYGIGSIVKDSMAIVYPSVAERVSSVRVDYKNAAKGYARDPFTVVDQDAEYHNEDTLSLVGVSRNSQAVRLGKRYLYHNRHKAKVVTFELPRDGMISERGDVIGVAHEIPQWGYSGRVVSATANTVTLDREITMIAGTSYYIDVLLTDGTFVEAKPVVTEPGTTATIQVENPWATQPDQYNNYSFGKTTKLSLRVTDIEWADADFNRFKIAGFNYSASVYDSDTEIPVLEDSPTALEPPRVSGLTLGEDLIRVGNQWQARLVVSWIPPWTYRGARLFIDIDDQIEDVYEVGMTDSSFVLEVNDGATCNVTVVAINTLGIPSPRESAPSQIYTVQGKTAPPENVTNFRAAPSLTGITLLWNAVSDIDLAEYVIRHTADTSSPAWESAIEIGRAARDMRTFHAAGNGTYLIKALDDSGVHSASAAQAVVDLPVTIEWNTVSTSSDATAVWDDGTATGLFERGDGNLQAAGAGNLWDAPDMWALPNVWMYGGTVSFAYYEFDPIDLGSIQAVRIYSDIRFYGLDWTGSLWNLSDVWAVTDMWGAIDDVYCVMQVAYKEAGGGSYSEWADYWTHDVTARYFKFRLKTWTNNTDHCAVVSAVKATIKAPQREETGNEAVLLAGETISFTKTFLITGGPRVGVQVIDGAAGDYTDISNVLTTSFDAQVRDSANNAKAGTIDWRAVGY